MKGFFISGTDTEVGKTVISASFLSHASKLFNNVVFHKPIQSGDDDVLTVTRLTTDLSNAKRTASITLTRPLSPHLAAHYENFEIDFRTLVKNINRACNGDFNIVEGAGGLLVPLNRRYLLIDLIKELKLPCVMVCRSSLGTINHTLLSIEALRHRKIPLLGIVMVGERNRDNEESIKFYGRVSNLIHFPLVKNIDHHSLAKVVLKHQKNFYRFFQL